MEQVIPPIIVLLILSLITEKISNVIKLQFAALNQSSSGSEEKLRQKRIQWISVVTGICVSIAAKANLFLMFTNGFNLFWDSVKLPQETLLSNITGSIVTGLFLSLGSKFFHDLLDLIFQVKSLKKKLNNKADWEFDNMTSVDSYLNEDEAELLENIVEPFRKQLISLDNVSSVILDYQTNKPLLEVHTNLNFNSDKLIPAVIPYISRNGVKRNIDVTIVRGSEPITHSSIFPTNRIINQNSYPNNRGSIGGKLYGINGEEFFVSCYHVVKSPRHKWEAFEKIGHESIVNVSDGDLVCGSIVTAIRDDEVDIALMKADDGFTIESSINGIGIPSLYRELNSKDKIYKTRVKMFGGRTGFSVGHVYDLRVPIRLSYVDGLSHRLNNIILIKAFKSDTFSLPGDSGSFVFDEYNNLIGILVGGHDNVSYVMPINTILTKTNTKISTT